MRVRTLMGVETEYALTALDQNGRSIDRAMLMELIFARAREHYPHVRDPGAGMFLANGSRLYLDRGHHPEFATPECGNPWDVVRYIRAGERIVLDLAERVRRAAPGAREVLVFRSNVDYDRSGTTWGCHESYLHMQDPRILAPELIPHLVTRIVYTGAGGFNPLSPGAEFTLSPRAWLLPNVTARDSTGERGIFHFRDEPLAGPGWERLHVICGESVCSDTAAVLKLGTTALVLAAIELNRSPGTPVRLAAPVGALRRIAANPVGPVELEAGGQLTPVQIQRHYLAQVENCPRQRMPDWAPDLCRLWRDQLDAIEAGAPALERTLDWAVKRAVYRRWVSRTMPWRVFQRASTLVEQLERFARHRLAEESGPPLTAAALLAEGELEARYRSRLEPLVTSAGLEWKTLRRFLQLRAELLETDFRFGQLGPGGVFEQLDRKGLLNHRQDWTRDVETAMSSPPAGRAAVRGRWIGQLWNQRESGSYRSDWSIMWNELTGRHLDLSDPFVVTADWR